MKEFTRIVLVVVGLFASMLVLAATLYAFFILRAVGSDEPGAGRYYAWLALVPAVAIVLLWRVLIRVLGQRGRRDG